MQNWSQLLSLSKCLPWPAELSSSVFFWEMQTVGLHSRPTASPSALKCFNLMCIFIFIQFMNFPFFFSFFLFFFFGYEACGILVA